MPAPKFRPINQEELLLAQGITARRAVEAELDPLRDPGEKRRAFGDFLLCSIAGIYPNTPAALALGGLNLDADRLRHHAEGVLLRAGIAPKHAILVSAHAADMRTVDSVRRLDYLPLDQEIAGIIRGPGNLDVEETQFIRGIIASAQLPIS